MPVASSPLVPRFLPRLRRLPLVAAATVGLSLLRAPVALAQNAGDQAAAEALFDQGKAAMAAHNYAEACPKFFESNRLDEGIGTSLWLAECYEKNGQTASAWAEFRVAAALAVKSADPREKVARARAQALEPKLAHILLVVPPASRLPGLRVARDRGEVSPALWGTSVPIDPGRHTVVVSAPDHRPQTLTVNIPLGPGEQRLEIPLLAEAPASAEPPGQTATSGPPAPSDAPAVAASHARFPAQRAAAIGAGAIGIVSLAVATYFGLHAESELDDSNAGGNCRANNLCNQTGVNDRSAAQSAATVSTALFVVAGAALAGGAGLWLTAPSGARPVPQAAAVRGALALSPWVDPRMGAGGVVLGADF
jgi:hypothetical protein